MEKDSYLMKRKLYKLLILYNLFNSKFILKIKEYPKKIAIFLVFYKCFL